MNGSPSNRHGASDSASDRAFRRRIQLDAEGARARARATREASARARAASQRIVAARASREDGPPVGDHTPPRADNLLTLVSRLRALTDGVASDPAGGWPATSAAASAPPAQPPVTPRQIEILTLIADGHTTGEVARRLWLSEATIRNHIARTLKALGAHSRLEAIAVARRDGLLP